MELLFDIIKWGVTALAILWFVSVGARILTAILGSRLRSTQAKLDAAEARGHAKGFEDGWHAGYGVGHLEGRRPQPKQTIRVGPMSDEMLLDLLRLTHPDRHPPERKELATRVTQQVNALRSKR